MGIESIQLEMIEGAHITIVQTDVISEMGMSQARELWTLEGSVCGTICGSGI